MPLLNSPSNPSFSDKVQIMPKHRTKTLHMTDRAEKSKEDAYRPPKAETECIMIGDTEDELEISVEDKMKEELIIDTQRLTLRDDIDREKFGFDKLLKQAPNRTKLTQTGGYIVTVEDAKLAINPDGPILD